MATIMQGEKYLRCPELTWNMESNYYFRTVASPLPSLRDQSLQSRKVPFEGRVSMKRVLPPSTTHHQNHSIRIIHHHYFGSFKGSIRR
jgi:hypothetical protein